MLQTNRRNNILFAAVLILAASASRLLPHPPNFTPIGAMAIFAGAVMGRKLIAFLIPVLAMFFADLALNNIVYAEYYEGFTWFTSGVVWIYGGMLAMTFLAPRLVQKLNIKSVVLASILGSAIFFLSSNFGVWMGGAMYTKDLTGLIACYAAGLPFLLNTLLGTLMFSGILFGAYHLVSVGKLKRIAADK